jgi:predicted RNA binding protein YcfA (HicA-like mRNA interferase family)
MPDWPVLSGAEIVRALERFGFRIVRQKGSHVIMRRGGVGSVVPMHWEVKIGTLSIVVRQARLQPEEFLAALKN